MKIKMLTIVLFLCTASAFAGEKELKTYLDTLTNFSGTVLVAKKAEPFEFRSYGMANRDFAVPNANDTKYNLGSINKIFTKVALLQLRDEGKLDFSKTLRTYLPDYPSNIADKVTIQQLIDHRSGVGDIFGPEFREARRDRIRTLADYLPLFVDKPLLFEPGTQSKYSNGGYILLGLVIEKLSGMSYFDYVKTKIFAPLGMNDTDSYATDDVVPRRATGYLRNGKPNVYLIPARGSSAGGGYSTAGDLLRFTRDARKVLSPRAFAELIGDNPSLGWAGGSSGINAVVTMEGGYTIIVLANEAPPAAEDVAEKIASHLGVARE